MYVYMEFPFGFKVNKQPEIVLNQDQNKIIISTWNWRKFGYKRKLVQILPNGDIRVTKF
tara:strand:+ start:155 stop:331 length:177 start_codon:yes stop_codon:yes gene_type:complete